MIVMTNFLLLIGAGLFSKAVWDFQEHMFNAMVSKSLPTAHLRRCSHALIAARR
jgi:high-affinity Fe2+/Pb2+ permease